MQDCLLLFTVGFLPPSGKGYGIVVTRSDGICVAVRGGSFIGVSGSRIVIAEDLWVVLAKLGMVMPEMTKSRCF